MTHDTFSENYEQQRGNMVQFLLRLETIDQNPRSLLWKSVSNKGLKFKFMYGFHTTRESDIKSAITVFGD